MTRHCGPPGAELAARRKAAGLTQIALAGQAGIGRTAVQYWERRPAIDPDGWAVRRMGEALGWLPCDYRREDDPERAARDAFEDWKRRQARRKATRRVICGAKTRKGSPCRNRSEPGRTRCKFHGGMSTGPRTPEGRARAREAARRRWALWRAQREAV